MNHIEEMLEFDKIKKMLFEYAVTDKARNRFDNLAPAMKESELRVQKRETTEARILLDLHGTPPLSDVLNIKEILESTRKGDLISVAEFETIRQFATQSSRIIRYLKKDMELELSIIDYGNGMCNLDFLKEEIDRCIRNGRIEDDASKELRDIRRRKERIADEIRGKLDSILKSKKECFSEQFVSNRNGHFTLPVKKEYKMQISGSVIDISSSGATFFIEPSSVAKKKEELGELEIAEHNEERRVLYVLSETVCDFENEILLNLEYIEELDFIFAKAKLSAQMDGKEPMINYEQMIQITEGKHPLLASKDCVPLSLTLGGENRGIVITGPNTGGKTVALKTVGLFSMMAQCGLHLPCKEASLCMSSKVLCDIGDGQSISENLSTFSAHIRNVIEILNQIDKDTLVLLDELGSGTDPSEGMGIAIAILKKLKASGANYIVTTHYPEIKEYARETEGIVNARMAFDKTSLKPLYLLEVGEAGESCALYIAKQLGMPEEMLKTAYEAAYGGQYKSAPGGTSFIEKEDLTQQEEMDKPEEKKGAIEYEETKKKNSGRAERFQIGDSVMVYPEKKIGIVFDRFNEKGEVGVQIQKSKKYVNHKRLQLKAAAKDMYPEDYDFSIIFDSVEVRKARHRMTKHHVEGLEIRY